MASGLYSQVPYNALSLLLCMRRKLAFSSLSALLYVVVQLHVMLASDNNLATLCCNTRINRAGARKTGSRRAVVAPVLPKWRDSHSK
jgi:hypothetical protein